MKITFTLLLSCFMLISSSLTIGQRNSQNKQQNDELSINRGQVNSTLNKVKNADRKENGEFDVDEELEIDDYENSKLEKSLKRETKKAVRKAIK